MDDQSLLCKGLVERIGIEGSIITHSKTGCDKFVLETPMKDHKEAIGHVLDALLDADHGVVKSMAEIGAVGHRVVHAGEKFAYSVLIADEVIEALKDGTDEARGTAAQTLADVKEAMQIDYFERWDREYGK